MNAKHKRDFGSFHASNVQELLSLPEEDYQPPKILIDQPAFEDTCGWASDVCGLASDVSRLEDACHPLLGHKAKKNLFFLEDDCCFLNHGAFGGALKLAIDVAHKWQFYSESQPLRFYDRELLPLLVFVTRQLAKFVGCDAKNLVLISNATYGTNSVLKSIDLGPKDTILTFSSTYGAVKKLVDHLCQKTEAKHREANIPLPVTDQTQILQILESELAKGDITIVVADHIPSNTPFIMPIKEMTKLCRNRKVKMFVDGAHSLGSIPLNLDDLDPDFYVSNAHKWLCCPKGVAFLYVKPEFHSMVRPSVVSHGLGSGFNSEFVWAGLHDYSPMLSLLTVLNFWKFVGVDTVQQYMHNTVIEGAKILQQAWGTSLAAPENMFGSMALVELPAWMQAQGHSYSHAEAIQNTLYHQFNIEVPVKSLQEKLYVRISAHIYNEPSDYVKLSEAVLKIHRK